MNKYFDLDIKNFLEFASSSYKSDKNYNSDLDIIHKVKISKKGSLGGVEKTINLEIDKRKKKIQIKVPKGIKNGQSILIIGQGKKRNNMYGNLIVAFKVK